jgi:hypothetical protein
MDMQNTYTYTARSVENSEQVITFTLQNQHMSVGLGAPMEQIEAVLDRIDGDEESAEGEAGQETRAKLWLKPVAISLMERGIGPFRIADVRASVRDDWLHVSAWYRAGGLALAPVTLMSGRVDNPQAAHAFAEELDRRKSEEGKGFPLLNVLDYWLSWVVAGALMFVLFQSWRRKATE